MATLDDPMTRVTRGEDPFRYFASTKALRLQGLDHLEPFGHHHDVVGNGESVVTEQLAYLGAVPVPLMCGPHAATEPNPSPSSRACVSSTSAKRSTRTAVTSMTATGWSAESITTARSPIEGSGAPSSSYSMASEVVVVFAPVKIAETS